MRNAFAAEITDMALADPRVVLLSGDIGNRLFDKFRDKCPDRFYNCGVAEANMMGVAAGMAREYGRVGLERIALRPPTEMMRKQHHRGRGGIARRARRVELDEFRIGKQRQAAGRHIVRFEFAPLSGAIAELMEKAGFGPDEEETAPPPLN